MRQDRDRDRAPHTLYTPKEPSKRLQGEEEENKILIFTLTITTQRRKKERERRGKRLYDFRKGIWDGFGNKVF
jgi:hypothetical protein